MYDYTDYPNWGKDKLIARLAEVSSFLAEAEERLAFAKSEEIRAKRDKWESNQESTATGRTQYITYTTVDYQISLWETEAEKYALTEEKWLIVRLLDAAY